MSAYVDTGSLQHILGLIGLDPGLVGSLANLTNAGIYATGGDYGQAGLSLASAIPIVGIAAKAANVGKLATRGGRFAVELGQIGERLAGITPPKILVEIAGRIRIPDELTLTILREIKNVQYLALTRQIRDYLQFAQDTGRILILEVRESTILSKPLQALKDAGLIDIRKTLP
jgi:hypothetical protein